MNAFQVRVLVLLSVLCFFEMVGYMAITPSLIFYVEDLGGTHTQYGLILSACSLSSFCCMSLYASWVDSNGNQYRYVGILKYWRCVIYIFIIVREKLSKVIHEYIVCLKPDCPS